jgi:hypothetical protein
MTPLKRPLAGAGAAVLLALSLTACGGGAPADASVEDFCNAVQGDNDDEALGKAVVDKDWDKVADLLKEQIDAVEEVGTPEDIPDDAREGFELQIDKAGDLSADDIEKAFEDQKDPFEADLSDDETKKIEAYTEYQTETCADQGGSDDSGSDDSGSDESGSGDSGSDDSSAEVPTEVPSDLGTEDIPSLSPEDLEKLESELAELTESAGVE